MYFSHIFCLHDLCYTVCVQHTSSCSLHQPNHIKANLPFKKFINAHTLKARPTYYSLSPFFSVISLSIESCKMFDSRLCDVFIIVRHSAALDHNPKSYNLLVFLHQTIPCVLGSHWGAEKHIHFQTLHFGLLLGLD